MEEIPAHPAVYVGNLAASVSDAMLFQHFSSAGTLVKARIERNPYTGVSLQYAMVVYTEMEEVVRAIHLLNGAHFYGKPLLVCWYGDCSHELHHYQRTIIIGNVQRKLKHRQIRNQLTPYGRVLLCNRPLNRHGHRYYSVFVLFESYQVARTAMECLQGCQWRQRSITVSAFVAREHAEHIDIVDRWTRSCSLYVDQLPPGVSSRQLTAMFAPYGKIARVVVHRPIGVPPYGLVQFASAFDMERAAARPGGYQIEPYQIRVCAFGDQEVPSEVIVDSWEGTPQVWPDRIRRRLAYVTVEQPVVRNLYQPRIRPPIHVDLPLYILAQQLGLQPGDPLPGIEWFNEYAYQYFSLIKPFLHRQY
uniref:RRM domain-containing protein n=1 Tax=Anopheles christyi TaxID=43041 RepID=A0A182K594_9DIPT